MHKAQWLAGLPSSWAAAPAWSVFADRGERSVTDAVHLTPSQSYGVLPQAEYMEMTGNRVVLNLTGQDTMKAVRKGDFIIHLRSFQGGLEGSALEGKVSAAYTVLKPAGDLNNTYYQYLLKSTAFVGELANLTFQLRDGQTVNYARFARMALPVPPLHTQQRIADYLDRETGEIDAMIAKMDQLAEQLEARRTSAVSRATSRGIDGATVVRSGNPYIGLIPEHWMLTRFAAEFDIEGGQVDPRNEPWASMVLVAPNHIVGHRGKIIGRETARDQGADSGKYVASEGQILYSKIRPALNKAAIAQEDCLISADMYALSSRTGSDHRYLVYMLLSSNFHGYVSEISMRVKMPKVNRDELSLAPLALPPLEEQQRIADHLDQVTSRIDQMLTKVAELKSLLTERRAALITEVVTGRKEVA